MNNILIECREYGVRVYNDGLLIIEAINAKEAIEIITELIKGNIDNWEVELLNNILYTINNNLSTNMEVA